MSKPIDFDKICKDYRDANWRLILLDFDGTLVPFEMHPDLTIPGSDVKSTIIALTADLKNHTVLISGRDRENLQALWGDTGIVLVAEHGAYYRNPGNAWHQMFPNPNEWVQKVLPSLNTLSFQYEGSFVERKSYSLAWHYRAISDKVTDSEKRQILAALRSLPLHEHFQIYDGQFTIELRTPGIDKGSFVARWVGGRNYDFIMAIGDGYTDEDLFKIFGPNAYTIKVGNPTGSAANFFLEKQEDVIPFLQNLHQNAHRKRKVNRGASAL